MRRIFSYHSMKMRCLSLFLSTLLLAGCAGLQPSLQKYDNVSDPCNEFRKPLIETETDLRKWVFGGAAAGAAAGAAGAAVVGGADTKETIFAALIGAVVGGTAGYLAGRRKQAKTDEELLSLIDGDAHSDTQTLKTTINSAIENLHHCRQLEIDTVRSQVEKKEMTKAEALLRAARIQDDIDQDAELISQVFGRMDTRYATYVDARAEVLQVDKSTIAADDATAAPEHLGTQMAEFELEPEAGQYVLKKAANIRTGPSTKSQIIKVLPSGTRIDVTGRTPNKKWYAFDHTNQLAFIYASLIRKADMDQEKDPLHQLAVETRKTKTMHIQQKSRTDRDIESLNILLSSVPETPHRPGLIARTIQKKSSL